MSEWNKLGVSALPTLPIGTVTLLLADVEGSTRLWETQPEEMTAAIAVLDSTLAELIARHDGVRPVEQGEGDSFVLAFARASDAVACALALQRAPLAPILLRIGVNTGEIQLRDEGNYIGPTINRTARLRDLGHGGQTVLSGATEAMVVDHLPADAWLTDLGTHPLRDLPRPERVVQLCHPDIRNEFPPMRTGTAEVTHHLPVQLTSFVGRSGQIADVRKLLAANRLVTLTGAGGVGKTRMALQVAATIATEFDGGTRYVDLAPITDPDVVPVAVARALGLPDQPGRSTTDTIVRSIGERRMLVVLDNCEHLLDASADLITALAGACAGLMLLTTSREPIGLAGESTWRVPSLSLADEAVELFADRARLANRDFRVAADDLAVITEICRRLDGVPLAIELAAARVHALSLHEINDSLHDRFRLLTGGSRTAVRRQQTLRASVDWSHALLSEPERVLFRRLAAFVGGFDLIAAQIVTGSSDVERYQVLDQLSLLVDKSLVVAESVQGRMRYRLLETVRQYAAEKLGESGEAESIRARHRGYYTSLAAELDNPPAGRHEKLLEQAESNVDNFRAAFAWSRECGDSEAAMQLASSLLPLWLARGRIMEGLTWFETLLADRGVDNGAIAPAVRAGALADKALLDAWGVASDRMGEAEEAVAIAREVGDRALLARALTACGGIASYSPDLARPYFTEAIELARTLDDQWRLSQILGWQAFEAFFLGDPIAANAAGGEGSDLAAALGDPFASRFCRNWGVIVPLIMRGDLERAIALSRELIAEADAAADLLHRFLGLQGLATALTYQGEIDAAQTAAIALTNTGTELGGVLEGCGHYMSGFTALSAGDVAAASKAVELGWQRISVHGEASAIYLVWRAEAALAAGDVTTARMVADDAALSTRGWHLMVALAARARIATAQGEPDVAERDVHEALAIAARIGARLHVPEVLEILGGLAGDGGSHREAARLFGATDAARRRIGVVRLKIHDASYEHSVASVRCALGDSDFDAAWAEGAALSIDEAIAYAQRGRGERKRPSSGWGSLTPTELDVVRLVTEGLGNKAIAARLFISHRTVQTHLTHVYTKLGLASRVQLAQEAARRDQAAL